MGRGAAVTVTAIFCRTGSAIQSALARWNLTSALEFTVKKGTREHGSPRVGKLSTSVTVLKQREGRHPTRCMSSCISLGLHRWPWKAPAKIVSPFWTKIHFQKLNAQRFSYRLLDSGKNGGMGSTSIKETCSWSWLPTHAVISLC